MDSFAARATVFTLLVVGIVIVGFTGFSSQIDVRMGTCESHYRRYLLKPFLVPVTCAIFKFKPCGDFAEHRSQMSHVQMYDCLCRDPQGNTANLRIYTSDHFKDGSLPTESEALCFQRPRSAPL